MSPRPILRRLGGFERIGAKSFRADQCDRPPSKDAWRARPVTDGQASLLKSKLEETKESMFHAVKQQIRSLFRQTLAILGLWLDCSLRLQELYLEQRFGPLNVQTDKLLYTQACQQPYRDFMGSRGQQGLCTGKAQDDGAAAATETEDLFCLTSEDGTLYSEATPLRGQALQQRPGVLKV